MKKLIKYDNKEEKFYTAEIIIQAVQDSLAQILTYDSTYSANFNQWKPIVKFSTGAVYQSCLGRTVRAHRENYDSNKVYSRNELTSIVQKNEIKFDPRKDFGLSEIKVDELGKLILLFENKISEAIKDTVTHIELIGVYTPILTLPDFPKGCAILKGYRVSDSSS